MLEDNRLVIRLIDSQVQVNNGRRTLFMVIKTGETGLNRAHFGARVRALRDGVDHELLAADTPGRAGHPG